MNFLVIGEKCLDVFVYGEVRRLSPEAPVPIFTPLKKVENGGMAQNVYNNLFALLEKKNCLYGHFSSGPIIKTRYVDDKTNHYFLRIDQDDIANPVDINKYLLKLISSVDCIIISDYNKGFLSLSDIYVICGNKKEGATVFLDTKKKIPAATFDVVDFIKLNEKEYEQNKELADEYKSKVIITKGGDGAYYEDQHFPSEKKVTLDVSGAGDTFLAALAFYYMSSKIIKYAIQRANEAACKVVQSRGVSVV